MTEKKTTKSINVHKSKPKNVHDLCTGGGNNGKQGASNHIENVCSTGYLHSEKRKKKSRPLFPISVRIKGFGS